MAEQLQLRRGSTAANDAFTGAAGELTVDTTLNELRLHDGSTAGGHTIGAGAIAGLDDLTDVTITTPATGAVLTYNGSAWVDGTVALADTDAVSGQLAVANGGTGGASAADARTNLGLAIGTNVQAYDAELAAIAGLTSAADKGIQFTGAGTAATYDLTAAAKTVLDDATVADMVNTLGGATSTGTGGLVRATSPTLVTPLLGTPTSGTLTNCTGLPAAGVTGTALVSAAIGTTVQAYDAELAAIAGLTSAADKVPYFTGAGTAAVADFTTAGRALVDDADASAQRTTLGFATDLLRENQPWIVGGGAGATLSNVAAADAFLAASTRNIQQIDLTPYTQVRMTVRVTTAATAGTKLVAVYHTAYSTTIGDYSAIGTSAVECALDATGLITTSWIDLAAGAKADVFTTIKQTGGDGATDPAIGHLTLQFRRR